MPPEPSGPRGGGAYSSSLVGHDERASFPSSLLDSAAEDPSARLCCVLPRPARLFERHQQTDDRLGVLDPAIPDHFEGVIAVDVDDLDELVFVESLFPGR